MKRLVKSMKCFFGRFICNFKGHLIEKFLEETDGYIATTRCSRCYATLMGGFVWKIKHVPPPNSNSNQVKEWEDYCENEWELLRKSTKKQSLNNVKNPD